MYGVKSNKFSKEQYEARLERGWRLIRMAREEGDEEKATRLEDFWLELLKEYEAMMDGRMNTDRTDTDEQEDV